MSSSVHASMLFCEATLASERVRSCDQACLQAFGICLSTGTLRDITSASNGPGSLFPWSTLSASTSMLSLVWLRDSEALSSGRQVGWTPSLLQTHSPQTRQWTLLCSCIHDWTASTSPRAMCWFMCGSIVCLFFQPGALDASAQTHPATGQ